MTYLFARLVVGSSKYSAVYSSITVVVLFNYLPQHRLVDCSVSGLTSPAAPSAPTCCPPGRVRPQVRQIHDQALALDVIAAIGRTHYFDEPKWMLESLSASGGYSSPNQVEQPLQSLQTGGSSW